MACPLSCPRSISTETGGACGLPLRASRCGRPGACPLVVSDDSQPHRLAQALQDLRIPMLPPVLGLPQGKFRRLTDLLREFPHSSRPGPIQSAGFAPSVCPVFRMGRLWHSQALSSSGFSTHGVSEPVGGFARGRKPTAVEGPRANDGTALDAGAKLSDASFKSKHPTQGPDKRNRPPETGRGAFRSVARPLPHWAADAGDGHPAA